MSRLKVTRHSNSLDISYNWRSASSWFLAVWAIMWNAFIIVFLATGASWFISFHALVGIIVGYFALTQFTNKTTISVNRTDLKLNSGPLPWPFFKDQKIPARSLVQLYVDKSSVRVNKKDTYNLVAKLDTGVTVKLLKSEHDRSLLTDLERTIEAYLDIKNDTSFDLSSDGHSTLDLEQMKRSLEAMEPLKKWLPKGMVSKMEEAQARVIRESLEKGGEHASASTAKSTGQTASLEQDDWDVSVRFPAGQPRPLPEPEHTLTYPLYRATEGSIVTWNIDPFRISRSAQIDWEDDDNTIGRQLELRSTLTNDNRYLYTELERGRWAYFEERRLEDNEVVSLGFDATSHPTRFENGDERYYPRNEQKGKRYLGGMAQDVRQFIYFTTASTTQFRALQPAGQGWEVYVMEAVDDGGFGKG